MASNRLACRECHHIIDPDENACPYCGSWPLTEDWAGYVVITHPEESEIAEKMEVTESGEYALKVR
ncbi:transcription elongation factor subunit Spt4 [Halanaeroarchaeum sulfurireducens]|uniref:Transcription elongation factor Spt4 n=1 Tax=Halanaeroarchaeum sulfurireducens TaxID=1604004 RepID=A0A0N9NCW0_9EURY|nr:transcription elongation factor subunit Spt4 [Halanaeroarchaeum sulfurireducens]ALG82845.1 DNA-directed RNA polymerase subunit E'' [Halanaeroarchaeum sulfurireducens]